MTDSRTDSRTVWPTVGQYDRRMSDSITVWPTVWPTVLLYDRQYDRKYVRGMVNLVGMAIWHWYALKTKQSPNMFLKHTVSIFTVKWMLAKLRLYRFKAQPAERTCSEGRTSNKCFLVVFSDSLQIWHGYTMETLNSHIAEPTCFGCNVRAV